MGKEGHGGDEQISILPKQGYQVQLHLLINYLSTTRILVWRYIEDGHYDLEKYQEEMNPASKMYVSVKT